MLLSDLSGYYDQRRKKYNNNKCIVNWNSPKFPPKKIVKCKTKKSFKKSPLGVCGE
jgi:hypothetical protein